LVRRWDLRIKFGGFGCGQERWVDYSARDVVQLDGDLNSYDSISDPPVSKLLEFVTYTSVLERGCARKRISDDQLIDTCLECIVMNAGVTRGADQENVLH